MQKKIIIFVIVLTIVFGTAEGSLETDDVCGNKISEDSKFLPISSEPKYKIEKFISNLDWPTTMSFVGSDLLVLQKNNGLVCHVNNESLEKIPVLDVNVNGEVEQGLVGITTRENEVFLYFTESEQEDGGKVIGNHIYKYLWNGLDLVEGKLIKKFPGDLSQAHIGGAMTTGIDGTIYSVTGDMRQEGKNQNFNSGDENETSIILPVDPLGEPIAKGIRNSFGLAIDPLTGNLWDTENSLKFFDEINLVLPNFNSGWKKIMGPASEKEQLSINIDGFEYSDPEFSWETPIAPTAISFVDSKFFPELKNSILVGDFNTGSIYEFKLNEKRTGFEFKDPLLKDLVVNRGESMNEIIFATGFAGITDIEVGPDGMIYVVTILDGTIYKITPAEIENDEIVPCSLDPKIRTDLVNCDFSNSLLQDKQFAFQDMSNVNLSGSNLTGSSFINSNLTGANLNGADLSNSDLSNIILTDSSLKDTILTGAKMSHSILVGVEMENAKMQNANLFDANFNQANLLNADLRDTNMAFASLNNTILENAKLNNANLNYAIFFNADLQKADLSNSDIYLANFSGSDMSGSKILDVYPYSTDFSRVSFSEETQTNTCLDTDDLSRFLNRLLRELRQTEFILTEPLESIIIQICKP
jgi:aldose sugar dehydrogenase